LGAYSIPSETGLLIPSDFVNESERPTYTFCRYRVSVTENPSYLPARISAMRSLNGETPGTK